MSKIMSGENQTKNLYLQRLVDGCIIILISLIVLAIYEDAWRIEHTTMFMSLRKRNSLTLFGKCVPNVLWFSLTV